ncbi:ferrous iron transport protein B [Sphingobacterium alimentarium]|uniref:Ferrous iron transport protein B n=1 Tax=Sphingobacterium alimentarium TaxID=797292 RepID=A0A4R3VZ90_9SPHI|nr:ferrous iron transport protein B [Sphingobacterium alimentarium]TCV17085.1 ferrous iron transport protein B [Sphingobacterium alimentarium]
MRKKTIALLGNPNVGKTSLFNRITGLNQKVGNYPGITVEKRQGTAKLNQTEYTIIDLPGTYTLFPNSLDEEVVLNTLLQKENKDFPDLVVVVSEPSTLTRGIIIYQQVRELGLPAIFVINMEDEMADKGLKIDYDKLESYLKTKVYRTNARNGKGIDTLIAGFENQIGPYFGSLSLPQQYDQALNEAKKLFPLDTEYKTWMYLGLDAQNTHGLETSQQLASIRAKYQLSTQQLQKDEAILRHEKVQQALTAIVQKSENKKLSVTEKIDEVLMHPILGYVIFFGILFFIFQAIYAWSGPVMDAVDASFAFIGEFIGSNFPEGPLNDLLVNGIIAGIGGIVIFLPQIIILFLFIAIMEETGYMSRVVFLMDRWLKPFGLNGKSVIPLMSGAACAIPAVMAARNIENPKERLLTMLVTPFMTCSARLPIYIVIIGLVIPDSDFLGFNLQGITLFAMYILGIVGALGSALVLNKIIKSVRNSFLIFELPTYKRPDVKNVLNTVWEKSMGFLIGAGKIILAISIILWVLGNFGPNDRFSEPEKYIAAENPQLSEEEIQLEVSAYKTEYSYLGYLGRGIEPAIRPLGYDWKIGIGLLASFAAREVFVGTVAVVYSLGDDVDIEDDTQKATLFERMKSEINRNTGLPTYNFATGISLLLFYAFAMQCMATIGVVRKETGSWKWTLIQAGFMTALAYIAALIAYQILK